MIARTVIRRGLRVLALALAIVLALGGLLAAALRIQFTGAPAAWAKSTGNDALWLGHAWVDGRRTEQDVERLAVRLRTTGIKDVYVHSGPFEWDGRLDPAKYPNAGNFVQWMRKHLPDIRISAWLGQAVKNGLDLDDARSRANVLAGVAAIMKQGYDGIHYNFEPIGDGDTEFLDLLDRTRQHTKLLSASTPQIEPYLGMRLTARALLGHDKYWSEGYFRQVVDRVDQVAIMTYDSFTPRSPSTAATWPARPASRWTWSPTRRPSTSARPPTTTTAYHGWTRRRASRWPPRAPGWHFRTTAAASGSAWRSTSTSRPPKRIGAST
ncbi:glycoside hydrolase family 18 protein [Nonomuraea thailandensis]